MIDIAEAESTIVKILPKATPLEGEINTKGMFLVFDRININEAHTGDIDCEFRLFISISSRLKNKRLVYTPITEALNALVTDWEKHQKVAIGKITPYGIKKLIVYQIPLTVKGFKDKDYVE